MPVCLRSMLAVVMVLALCSCDTYEQDVKTGQETRDQAKEVVAVDAEQKIAMARQLISLGKVTDAQRLLEQLNGDAAKLPEGLQEKLAAANGELERAKAK